VSNRGKPAPAAGCRRTGWASCAYAQAIQTVKEAEMWLGGSRREEDRGQNLQGTEWQHGWGL